jgi:16S rRNA (uracil1498-N3)-methyltransferase
MQLFYASPNEIETGLLSAEESKHAVKVLRKKAGDVIQLIDGCGNLYEAIIIETTGKQSSFKIKSHQEFPNTLLPLHIAIAPTKNIDRFEFFLEKSIEMGIREITPIYCEHSERKRINIERIQKRLISACKQSKAYHFPKINEEISLTNFLIQTISTEQKFIAHCSENVGKERLSELDFKKSTLILIGPEGDFSENEVELSKSKDFKELDLGKRRLRTETAGIFCVSAFSLGNQ